MSKKNIVKELALVADHLDKIGLFKQANEVDLVLSSVVENEIKQDDSSSAKDAAQDERHDEESNYMFSHIIDQGAPGERPLDRIDATHDGREIGFVTYHQATDGDYVWIKGMYVDPDYRGHGIGRRLIDEVSKRNAEKDLGLRARPFRDMNMSQQQLEKFYSSMGFKKTDEEGRMRKTVSRDE